MLLPFTRPHSEAPQMNPAYLLTSITIGYFECRGIRVLQPWYEPRLGVALGAVSLPFERQSAADLGSTPRGHKMGREERFDHQRDVLSATPGATVQVYRLAPGCRRWINREGLSLERYLLSRYWIRLGARWYDLNSRPKNPQLTDNQTTDHLPTTIITMPKSSVYTHRRAMRYDRSRFQSDQSRPCIYWV